MNIIWSLLILELFLKVVPRGTTKEYFCFIPPFHMRTPFSVWPSCKNKTMKITKQQTKIELIEGVWFYTKPWKAQNDEPR
jgi:hypothetical protein